MLPAARREPNDTVSLLLLPAEELMILYLTAFLVQTAAKRAKVWMGWEPVLIALVCVGCVALMSPGSS